MLNRAGSSRSHPPRSLAANFASKLLPSVMDMITEANDFPTTFKLPEVIILSLIIQIFVLLSTYIASNRIAKLKLRMLLTE